MKTSDKILKVRLDEIKPSEENPDIYNRPHEDRIRKLANDIKRNGLLEPLIITSDNIILSGHTRYRALQHLGSTFVKVRRYDISSNHPDFMKLLISCNDQRDKTKNEKFKEIKVDVDPLQYIRDVQRKRNAVPDGLKKVNGELKSKRTLTDNYKHLVDAIKKIVKRSFRITLRGVFYKLLNDPPIESLQTGRKFSNCQRSYQLVSKVATKMRVNGIIDYDSIVDEKRKFKQYYKSGNVETFIENEVASFLDDYDRDLLQSQERFVAIVCEKETLSYQIDRANREYALPVLYTQGNSSITVRHSLIREARDRPITLLMLTDLDPSGMKIQDSFVGSLEKDFENKDLRAYRVALKTEHIEEYNLFSDQTAKISDTSFKKFHKVTGLKNAYELDAMDPDDMVELLEKSIRAVLDMDRFNEQLRIYQDDVADLSIKRQKALGSMII